MRATRRMKICEIRVICGWRTKLRLRIEPMIRMLLSRNANFVSRRGRRMRRGTHRFSCVWPPGCLFFAHEGHGCSRISFRQLMIRIKLMRHALCLCSSGVVALLPTNYTNGHESFVNGFYGFYGYTSLNLNSLAVQMRATWRMKICEIRVICGWRTN